MPDNNISQTPSSNTSARSGQGLGAAAERVEHRVEDAARAAVSSAKDALSHVKEESSALLHGARDVAAESYGTARSFARDAAYSANDLAHRASQRTVSYARGASYATGRFASTHALPLAFLGASLGWLAWSIRQEARRSLPREYDYDVAVSPRRTRLQTTLETGRSPFPAASSRQTARFTRDDLGDF
jgi:ElaB/YqjD/DUF883 family membrane-anchored ribosome-binding protein